MNLEIILIVTWGAPVHAMGLVMAPVMVLVNLVAILRVLVFVMVIVPDLVLEIVRGVVVHLVMEYRISGIARSANYVV